MAFLGDADELGVKPLNPSAAPQPQRSALGAGFAAGVDDVQAMGYGALGAIGRAAGFDSMADWAEARTRREQAESYLSGRPDLNRIEDVGAGNALEFLGYQIARQVPMIGATLAGSVVVPGAAIPATAARGLAAVPRGLGGGGLRAGMSAAEREAALRAGRDLGRTVIAGAPLGAGSMYGEAVQEGEPTRGQALEALGLSPVHGALGAVLPSVVRQGIGRGATAGAGSLATRVPRAAAVAGAGEAAAELGQNELEMGFAGDLTPEEITSRRLNAAVIGGLVGGSFGAAGGVRRAPPRDTREPMDLLNAQQQELFADLPEAPAGALDLFGNPMPAIVPVDPTQDAGGEPSTALAGQPRNLRQMSLDFDTEPVDRPGTYFVDQLGYTTPTQQPPLEQRPAYAEALPRLGRDFDLLGDPLAAPAQATEPVATAPQPAAGMAPVTDERQMALDLREPVSTTQTAREAYIAAGGRPSTWARFVSRRNFGALGPEQQMTALDDRAAAPSTMNPEPWAAALAALRQQVGAPEPAPELTQAPQMRPEVSQPRQQPQAPVEAAAVPQAQAALPTTGTPTAPLAQTAAQAPAAVPAPPQGQPTGSAISGSAERAARGRGRTQPAASAAQPSQVVNAAQSQEVDRQTPSQAAEAGQGTRGADATSRWSRYLADTDGGGDREAALAEIRRAIPDERTRAIIFDALGWDADGNATRAPLRGKALAEKYGISEGRVSQILRGAGLSQARLDRVLAESRDSGGLETVDETALGEGVLETEQTPEEAAPDIGLDVVDDPDSAGAVQGGLSVRSSLGSQGEVEATNDARAEGQYAGQLRALRESGDLARAEAAWAEQAAEAAETLPERSWAELGPGQKVWFAEGIAENPDAAAELYESISTLLDDGPAFSRGSNPLTASTAADVRARLEGLFPDARTMGERLRVVQSVEQLREALPDVDIPDDAQAVTVGDRVYLVADQIVPGHEMAVFLHEVGSHLGLDRMLPAQERRALTAQIEAWAREGDSQAARIARAALERVATARAAPEGLSDADAQRETLAYFIEEAVLAGVDPTATRGPLGQFFQRIIRGLRRALASMGITRFEALRPQDIVDLAYGAAQLEARGANDVQPGETRTPLFSRTQAIMRELDPRAQEFVQRTSTSLRTAGRHVLYAGIFTNDLVANAAMRLPSAERWYRAIKAKEVEKTRREARVDAIATLISQLSRAKGNDQFSRTLNLARDMTMQGEWAYQPSWITVEATDVNASLAARWSELSSHERGVLDRMLRHGYETRMETQGILEGIINEEFAERESLAKSDVQREALARDKAAALRRLGRVMSTNRPYAPLRRVGSHVVVGRSQRLLDAIKANETSLVRELEADENHYMVRFVDSQAEAEALTRTPEMARYAERTAVPKMDAWDRGAMPFNSFERIRASIEALPEAERQKVGPKLREIVTELYLSSLSEYNARQSERKRLNVAGMDPDGMLRAFVSKGQADAHYIATLKNNSTILTGLRDMAREARESRNPQAIMAYNELSRRWQNSLEFQPAGFAGKLMGFASVWQLLTKPAYYLYNATQPLLMSHPYIAGRYGWGKSMDSFMQAYKEYMKTPGAFSPGDVRLDRLPADVRQAVQELADQGRIDITLVQDLGAKMHGSRSLPGRTIERVHGMLRTGAQKAEMMNRVVTAMAAYRLARAGGKDHAGALDYAGEVIDRTHGDYTNFNAPRVFNANAIARLLTQFKKFALIQSTFLVRSVQQAVSGASAEERFMARRALAFTLGHHMVLAGGLGLLPAPARAIIEGMLNWGDEPDEELEARIKRRWGSDPIVELLLNGVPSLAGVNMSGNVGLQGAFDVSGFDGINVTSREGWSDTVMGMMGPVIGGLGSQFAGALGKMIDGDYYGGIADTLPSGLRYAMRAAGEATRGVRAGRTGDMLVDPSDIELADTLAKAVGLRTTADANRQLVRSAQYRVNEYYTERSRRLRRDYSSAYRDGDSAQLARLREQWMDLQDSRRRYGFKVQPLSDLIRAPREQSRREARVVGGVQSRGADAGYLEQFSR